LNPGGGDSPGPDACESAACELGISITLGPADPPPLKALALYQQQPHASMSGSGAEIVLLSADRGLLAPMRSCAGPACRKTLCGRGQERFMEAGYRQPPDARYTRPRSSRRCVGHHRNASLRVHPDRPHPTEATHWTSAHDGEGRRHQREFRRTLLARARPWHTAPGETFKLSTDRGSSTSCATFCRSVCSSRPPMPCPLFR